MAISEQQVLSLVKVGLGTLAGVLPFPFNVGLQVVGELVDSVVTAVEGGGKPSDIVEAVKAALVAASDADMRSELGP